MTGRQPRYQAGEKIGGQYLVYQSFMGGMGEVYLCLDEENRIPYALKTFQKTNINLQKLFEGEVRTWIDLGKHPNIVQCFVMQILDNAPFMLLEWVQSDAQHGTDLRSWLRDGALDLKQSLKFAIDICRGLAYAGEKSKGIVHRDLKPDNVLVAGGGVAKITDFGLATIIQGANLLADADTTTFEAGKSQFVGSIVGTPAYMPPEQWRGENDIDARADMYAVGCILYEMLTGQMVYRTTTISQLRIQHFEAEIPQAPNAPAQVNAIIRTCLAKNRDARYPTMGALLDELTRFYESHIGETLPLVQAGEMTSGDYNNRGVTYYNLKLHELALVDYDQAIYLNPNLAQAYSNRGNSYADLGQYEQAIADLNEAIRLNPTFADAYTNRGATYNTLKLYELALADLNEAIRLNPMLAGAYSNRGSSYAGLGQHARAFADFDESVRLNPTFAKGYMNRGNGYQNLGQYERAIADYDQAIRLSPTDANTYYNRGSSYEGLGQYKRAIADYDQAIRLSPTFVEAYSNRGIRYADLGQYERAIADYDEAIRLNPTFTNAWFNKGVLYIKMRRLQEALTCFEKAYQLGDIDALRAIQQVKQMMGRASSSPQNDGQIAFDAFAHTPSIEALRGMVGQFSLLIEPQFIELIEGYIQTRIPPDQRPELEKRLVWLKQIAGGG